MIVEALNLFMIPQHIEMQAVLPDNDEERVLLKLISHEPCHVDELIRGSGLATTFVSSTLMMMELKGMIRQIGGMQYVFLKGREILFSICTLELVFRQILLHKPLD